MSDRVRTYVAEEDLLDNMNKKTRFLPVFV